MGIKVLVSNRKAFHNYQISDRYESGIALQGTEVKSVRLGKISLKEGWVEIDEHGNAWLMDVHIAKYSFGNQMNHEEVRPRQLLLKRRELYKLSQKKSEQGFSIVPLKVYLKRQYVKVELGVAKGKKLHDKRESTRSREADREMARALKRRN